MSEVLAPFQVTTVGLFVMDGSLMRPATRLEVQLRDALRDAQVSIIRLEEVIDRLQLEIDDG